MDYYDDVNNYTILEDNLQTLSPIGNISYIANSAIGDNSDEKIDVCTFPEIPNDMCVNKYMDLNDIWDIDPNIKIDNDFVGPNTCAFWGTLPIIAKALMRSKPTQEIIDEKERLLEFQKGKAIKKENKDIKGLYPFAKPQRIQKEFKLSKSIKKCIMKNTNYQPESTKILIFEDDKFLGSFVIKIAKCRYFIYNMCKIIKNVDPNIHWKMMRAYSHINSIRRIRKLSTFKINITLVLITVKRTTKSGVILKEPVLTCQDIQF